MNIPRRKSQGNALVVTLITIAVIAGFIGLALDLTSGVTRNVQRDVLMRQAINIGDASTEMIFADWRATCIANSATAAPMDSVFSSAALPSPSPGNFPGVNKYALLNFGITPVDSTWTPIGGGNAVPTKTMGPNPQDYSYYYLASADVIVPTLNAKATWATDNTNSNGNVVAHVRRILQKYRHNKTDKAIDYKDDLEIHPGPPFVVNGDVHTNGDLYTGHNTLTLNGSTSYAGTWSIGFMPGDSTHPETPASPSWADGLPPSQSQAEVPYGIDIADYHSVIDIVPATDPLYPYSYSNSANYTVKVTIDASNKVKIYNDAGADITAITGGTSDGQTATLFKSAVSTNGTITDDREGATTGVSQIRVVTLDLSAITAQATNATNKIDFSSPVIYITDISADPTGMTNKRAIRLKNGASLPANGLTIVSGNPIYIQGDYNTGTNGTNVPVSDTTPDATNAPSNNPASPTVTGYTRKPSAVIADAVTILSNSWNDANSPNSVASNTTVNTAIISGIVPTGNGYYSGGAENFPRFLENWDGKTLTYYGSMIELFNSKQAIGHWGAANVYSPPNRAWYFDTDFLSSPPPGVPYDVDYIRSRWYIQ